MVIYYDGTLPGQLSAVSSQVAGPLAKGQAFAAGTQDFSPKEPGSGREFDLGAAFGISDVSTDKVLTETLPNKLAGPFEYRSIVQVTASLPEYIPLGLAQFSLRAGLPFGWDLGLRAQAMESELGPDDEHFSGYGLELRRNFLSQGPGMPVTLTLAGGYSCLDGTIHAQGSAYQISDIGPGGAVLAGSAHSTLDTVSDTEVFSVRATLSRNVFGAIPYLGLAAESCRGGTKVTTVQDGDVTINVGGGPYAVAQHLEGSASQIAPSGELRLGGGLKLKFGFAVLELGAEYGIYSRLGAAHAQVGGEFR